MKELHWAVRELRGQRSFLILFLLNITLGLLGLGLINTWKDTFELTLDQKSRDMLGADAQMSARRIFDDKLIADLSKISVDFDVKLAQTHVLYTMASRDQTSRLIELRAVDDGLPFYGTIKLSPPTIKPPVLSEGSIWIYPEIASQLAVTLGNSIKIGEKNFKVSGIIEEDPAGSWAGSSLAPRAYIRRAEFSSTDLIKKGSTIWSTFLFKSSDNDKLDSFITTVKKKFPDPGINISGHRESGEQSNRLFRYLSDYLSLVSITALIMSGIAASWLFRQFFERRRKSTAIFICLGASRNQAFALGVIQILFLSFTASVLATALTLALSDLLLPLIKSFLPWDITPKLGWFVFIKMFVFAAGTALVVCLPWLMEARSVTPNLLLSETGKFNGKTTRYQYVGFSAQIIFFTLVAIYESNSLLAGSLFSASMILSTICIIGISKFVKTLGSKFLTNADAAFRHGFLKLVRYSKDTSPAIVAIAMATVLTTLIPSVRESLKGEFEVSSDRSKPGTFIFDIQDEQRKQLEELLLANEAKVQLISPLIRSRLLKVNGAEVSRMETETSQFREDDADRAMRNRGYNLSYRDKLDSSETITKGKWVGETFESDPKSIPAISVEERFADRTGVKLGDILTFDVEGVEVSGKIQSLRSVKWTSFQPNFFVQFQPGVLDDAPKTWIASLGSENFDTKMKIQTAIVQKFPNITVLDVDRILAKLLDLVNKTSFALSALAWICFICGLLVMASITRQLLYERQKDITLFKIIGADRIFMTRLLISEVSFLSLLGSTCGVFLGWGMSQILSVVVFKAHLTPPSPDFLGLIMATWGLCVALSWFLVKRIANQKVDLSVISG